MGPVLVARQLCKIYGNGSSELRVIDNLDIELQPGSLTVITGESGCGKSTLLHLLGGMDKPTSGTITVDGIQVSALGEEQLSPYRMRTAGFVFQFHHLLRDFTARENLLLAGMISGQDQKVLAERADELLERVGIAARANAYPSDLSGGERQRAAVARALINDPKILFADEPTGSLDEVNSQSLEKLLFDLPRSLGKTLVMVTHNPRLGGYADRHLVLRHGKLEEAGAAL